MVKNSPKKSINPYKEGSGQQSRLKGKQKVKNQRSDFTLEIQVSSSALRYHKEKCHTLTYDDKATFLKDRQNVSMMGMAFNALVPHYFYNRSMAFSFLLMVEFYNEISVETLKDFLIDKTLDKPWGKLF